MDKSSRAEREEKVEDRLNRQWGSHEQRPETENKRDLKIFSTGRA